MNIQAKSNSLVPFRSIPRLSVFLRTFCDIVAAGLTTVIASIVFIPNQGFTWLTTFVGIILLGGIVLLLSRATTARIAAMAAHTLAIVLIASVTARAAFYTNLPDDTIQLILLLMLFPATMLLLLTVDHYFVSALAQPLRCTRIPLKRRLWRVGFLIVAALMLMTCVVTGFWLAKPLLVQWQSRAWENSEATMVECEIVLRDGSTNLVDRVDVHYEFEVDGVREVGSQIHALPSVFSRYSLERAEILAAALAPGTVVQVAYNPAQPEESLLLPGITGELLLLLLELCFYFFSFPVYFYYLTCRDSAWLTGVPFGSKLHDYWFITGNPVQESAAIGAMSFAIASMITVGIVKATTAGEPSLAAGAIAWAICIAIGGLSGWHVYLKAVKEAEQQTESGHTWEAVS